MSAFLIMDLSREIRDMNRRLDGMISLEVSQDKIDRMKSAIAEKEADLDGLLKEYRA